MRFLQLFNILSCIWSEVILRLKIWCSDKNFNVLDNKKTSISDQEKFVVTKTGTAELVKSLRAIDKQFPYIFIN